VSRQRKQPKQRKPKPRKVGVIFFDGWTVLVDGKVHSEHETEEEAWRVAREVTK
jgi:hypothetical protein